MTSRLDREPEVTSLKLSIEVEEINHIVVLHCAGRICFQREAELFSRRVREALQSGFDLVLDMSGVSAVDSAGIGQLVLSHMHAQAAQCQVRMAAVPGPVMQLLELTNVASLFDAHPEVHDAVASLSRELA